MMIARQGTMMTEKHRWHPICPSPSSHWDADVCKDDNDVDHQNAQNILLLIIVIMIIIVI